MAGVRKSLLLSLVDSYLGLVLQVAGTVVLSRLLTPTEVGVFAIAAVFSAMATTFRDFGVAEYMIQERELSADKIRAALAMNIIVSWTMAALFFGGAPFAAQFYREPGVGEVMRVLALNFVLVPFGAVTQAWFRREMNYRPVFICNLLSNTATFLVSVLLALQGFGYMSLAWGSFCGIAAAVLATVWLRPKEFPRWPGLRAIGPVFHFGKYASLIYVFAQLGRGAPELIIGRAQDAAAVGLYSRAGGLTEMLHRMLLRPVLMICMPYFAGQGRERGSIAPAYAGSVSLLTAAGWPFLAVMSVLAYSAIHLIYGAQWVGAVPLAQVLCLACAFEVLSFPSREALLACGDARRASLLQVQIVVLQVMGLLAVFPFGLMGASWGLVLAAIGGVAVSQWHLRHAGVGTTGLLRACLPSLLLTVTTAGPLALAAWVWPADESNYLRWAAWGALVASLSWLAALRQFRHPLWAEIAGYAQRAWSNRRGAA